MEQVNAAISELLLSTIRSIEDFPKEGISFKDITPLLQDPHTLDLTSRMLAMPYRGREIDYVIGLESRGFLFGTNLAQDLHAGFIPVRKPGKLPSSTIKVTYDLEYGQDAFEMHSDALKPNAKVVIHDDLIATGGSVLAATKLVEKLGAEVTGYSFILEIESLEGRLRLPDGVPVHTLIKI